ncbi:DMT family transporter [Paenibacillus chondroitinus]|uniref:DMT family transporter n=1 Tax=Paenibacillus chondroitinus TaxID=59842 RepID=A0ABU6D7P1_9BACL|nr:MULTISPECIES: DMT family transporter [Paenibacillus]MCY9661685.1 DMT family transporter [Paenibacillus anseongense]MEB4793770.1 DMT family transporter [Paenibacillus chondroitinus]
MNKMANGWFSGMLGVLIFSGSLPATRLAVMDFQPLFLTVCRAAIAGVLAGVLLLIFRQQRPLKSDIVPLLLIALCVVVGFPLLTALALQYVTASHAIIYVGLLPLSTAIFGVWRGGERPRPIFWMLSVLGSSLVVGFALINGASSSFIGDGLMLASIIACGYGYAEGARLSRRLGGWQVISWALILSLPVMALLSLSFKPDSWSSTSVTSILSLAYVSLFSMLIGFVFWYRGLALGGIAAVGQLQLLQPFFGLLLSALLLHESIGWPIFMVNMGVVLCVAFARRFAAK